MQNRGHSDGVVIKFPYYTHELLLIKMVIPKIIHQIWVGPNNIPEKLSNLMDGIKRLHPEYQYRLWTDKDLTPENFLNLDYITSATRYAQKADIMRFEILYRYGGIYFDTDFELFKNISPLLTNDLVVCNEDENTDHYITNAFIASSVGNANMKRCVDNIPSCPLNGMGGGANYETGPWYLRKNMVIDDKVRILPTHVMYPVHYNQKNDPFPKFSSETYGVHHWEHSWK